ncbi:hypothetical protein DAPPUDRAFT_313178 [Daphnia pulex]|uniref:Uncharacterized protein n=1 Tax=Daphnia pulex TaxID=6669 RepID=E9G334_DAPPU|nr:hypothetical protein DAPPUDRAFT_313178 [Daphnia pulex]|eukprot:EFX86147.1 hypothetical protein DAPPUDRAFT_313178 [Daphnia pulex]
MVKVCLKLFLLLLSLVGWFSPPNLYLDSTKKPLTAASHITTDEIPKIVEEILYTATFTVLMAIDDLRLRDAT